MGGAVETGMRRGGFCPNVASWLWEGKPKLQAPNLKKVPNPKLQTSAKGDHEPYWNVSDQARRPLLRFGTCELELRPPTRSFIRPRSFCSRPNSSQFRLRAALGRVPKSPWQEAASRVSTPQFFESRNGLASFRFNSSQMTGNPVRFRDGCATVTGYKLPLPLINGSGRRERGLKPEVRIPVWSRSSAPNVSGQLLRQREG